MKQQPIFLFIAFFLCACWQNANARIYCTNGRLDRVLYEGYEPQIIVAVEIADINGKEKAKQAGLMLDDFPLNTCNGCPANVEFLNFVVTNIIIGDSGLTKTKILTLNIQSFEWPQKLVKLKRGEKCILVLRKNYGDKEFPYSIQSVVPSHSETFRPIKTNTQARTLLAEEILKELVNEDSLKRQNALLMLVAPILEKEMADKVVPFLKSKDEWTKRIALGALISATENEEYLKQGATDIQQFFSVHKESETINGIDEGIGYAPFPYYFDRFFFLQKNQSDLNQRWSDEDRTKNQKIFDKLKATKLITEKVLKMLAPA